MKFQTPVGLVSIAIAGGATTPTPADGVGAQVWSSIINAVVVWDGSRWQPVATSGPNQGMSLALASGMFCN